MAALLFCGPTVDITETATGGGVHPTRLTAPSKSVAAIALANNIIVLDIPPLEEFFSSMNPEVCVGSGVETVTYSLPIGVESMGKASQHDIQTISHCGADKSLLACIDKSGGAYFHRLHSPSHRDTKRVKIDKSLHVVRSKGLPQVRPCEYSWAGLSFNKDGGTLGVCHGVGRWVGTCDVATNSATNLGWMSRPVQDIDWFNSHTLAFAETESLTLWDIRCEVKTSSFTRCVPISRTMLHCVTTVSDHIVACAGHDRTIHMVDDRTMKVVKHWRSPCKFDITSLHPSSRRSEVMYLSGLDNEILTCNTGGIEKTNQQHKRRPKLGTTNRGGSSSDAALRDLGTAVGGHGRLHQSHNLGIRADARWIGVCCCEGIDEEYMMGISANGTMNILRSPDLAKQARS